jgi:hypothetical protein
LPVNRCGKTCGNTKRSPTYNPSTHNNTKLLLASTQHSFSCNSQIKCFRALDDVKLVSESYPQLSVASCIMKQRCAHHNFEKHQLPRRANTPTTLQNILKKHKISKVTRRMQSFQHRIIVSQDINAKPTTTSTPSVVRESKILS